MAPAVGSPLPTQLPMAEIRAEFGLLELAQLLLVELPEARLAAEMEALLQTLPGRIIKLV